MRGLRRQISGEQRHLEQDLSDEHLIQLVQQWNGAIAIYMAMPEECSCQAVINYCWKMQRSVLVPKVTIQKTINWHPVNSMDELAPGAYGILEPLSDSQVDISLPDNVLLIVGSPVQLLSLRESKMKKRDIVSLFFCLKFVRNN